MDTHQFPERRRSRLLRWLLGLAALAVLLAVYAIALHWFTQRVETDVQKSIRALPAAGETAPH